MRNNRIGNIQIPIHVINDEPWIARCIVFRKTPAKGFAPRYSGGWS